GTYLMPIRSSAQRPEYEGKAEQLTPAFWRAVDCALNTADSLGLEVGIHICDGFALAGGPWFTPEESMQKVVWADTVITVGQKRKASKKRKTAQTTMPSVPALPTGAYHIAAYAIPADYAEDIVQPVRMTTSGNVTSDEKNIVRANEPCWFTYEMPEGVTIRNVEVTPSGTNMQCQRLKVETSQDGETFSHLMTFVPARQGWQNGNMPSTYALPQTSGPQPRYYRFSWTPEGTEPGSEDLDAAKWKPTLRLKSLVFHQQPRIHHWEGKAANVWRVAQETTDEQLPGSLCTPLDKIIRLEVSADGTLLTELPEGRYRILNMGHISTGQTNETAGGGKGLECDKFSAKAVNKLIDNWFAKFTELPSGHVVKYLHVDSWECGCQNWSETFAQEFMRRRGYDLMPWLPVMAGVPVVSAAETERVLRDIRLTINDLVNDNFFATVRDRAHAMGMGFSSESIAPTMVADGIDHYRYADFPMGEYWLNSPTHDKPNDMLDAISGGHVYGKRIIQAEGFTELRGVWDETPANIKTLLDRNFAMGMNRLFFHVNAHNPWMDRRPGMTLDGIGLFFQRDQTWFAESRPFVDYITRCSALLQQGRPVQDIAVFTGEEMPRRSVLPERLVDILPGIFGQERVNSERVRRENKGCPMVESPVNVNHSAGIVDTKDWCDALHGYQYDSFNPDVLMRLSKAEDGCMRLPGGARYRVVVLPGHRPMDPSFAGYSEPVMQKIRELRDAGVVVVDKPYTAADFSQYGLERDAVIPDNMAYAHRSAETGEIYFVSNQLDEKRDVEMRFRDTAQGEWYIYDAVSNTLSQPSSESIVRTVMQPGGSCFVIYPKGSIGNVLSCLPSQPLATTPVAETRKPVTIPLTGPFTLTFAESGVEKTITSLYSWSDSEDIRERFFSGHGRYTTTVKVKRPQAEMMLQLGTVRDIAHVWVNGIDCGIAWTAPYTVTIGHALRRGTNTIEIEVVNTWANALRGMDEGTPPYDGIWTNARYRMKSPHLLPSGLLGPVAITLP
ncbi:MAG: glycosyl hydrolase, partial [Prevotella sp.]|nr:glycosyl hydrolase [Bacteroidales bacterium]MDY5877761.1 glycosyl hydrolase [Prevotella sp.]